MTRSIAAWNSYAFVAIPVWERFGLVAFRATARPVVFRFAVALGVEMITARAIEHGQLYFGAHRGVSLGSRPCGRAEKDAAGDRAQERGDDNGNADPHFDFLRNFASFFS